MPGSERREQKRRGRCRVEARRKQNLGYVSWPTKRTGFCLCYTIHRFFAQPPELAVLCCSSTWRSQNQCPSVRLSTHRSRGSERLQRYAYEQQVSSFILDALSSGALLPTIPSGISGRSEKRSEVRENPTCLFAPPSDISLAEVSRGMRSILLSCSLAYSDITAVS